MSLLAFKNPSDSPMKKLLDFSDLQELASEVNKVILDN